MNGPEVEQLRQAVGLATTAKPSMVMRPDDPIGMMQEIVAQTAALLAEIEQLRTERDALLAVARAAQAFEQKLATVQANIDGAFMFQQMHGFPYRGPTYADEITLLRDVLANPIVQRLVKENG